MRQHPSQIPPALMQRLHRAAMEIENEARSRSRSGHGLAMAAMGRGLNWSFSGADLLHVLGRNRIEITEPSQ